MAESDPAKRFPRRSAKRLQTRARILDAADAQFKRVGYSDATMNAIAEAADVHVTTLFTHFKAKRDLATSLAEGELAKLAELIATAQGTVPFFVFFRDLVLTVAATREAEGDPKRGFGDEMQRDPELALGWLRYEQEEVRLLAAYIAHDYGLRSQDYSQYLVAHALIASGVVSHARWRSRPARTTLMVETAAALDLVERMARAILPEPPSITT